MTAWIMCIIIKDREGVFVVYAHLKELRESLGMTQEEFGKSIGIAKSTYNNYEKGIRDPKSDFWIAVAQKYNVTIDYLMGYSDDPHRITSRSISYTGLKISELIAEYRQTQDQDRLMSEIENLVSADRETLLALALKIIYAVQKENVSPTDAGGPQAIESTPPTKATPAADGPKTPPEGK